jgi:hypothetical protein
VLEAGLGQKCWLTDAFQRSRFDDDVLRGGPKKTGTKHEQHDTHFDDWNTEDEIFSYICVGYQVEEFGRDLIRFDMTEDYSRRD